MLTESYKQLNEDLQALTAKLDDKNTEFENINQKNKQKLEEFQKNINAYLLKSIVVPEEVLVRINQLIHNNNLYKKYILNISSYYLFPLPHFNKGDIIKAHTGLCQQVLTTHNINNRIELSNFLKSEGEEFIKNIEDIFKLNYCITHIKENMNSPTYNPLTWKLNPFRPRQTKLIKILKEATVSGSNVSLDIENQLLFRDPQKIKDDYLKKLVVVDAEIGELNENDPKIDLKKLERDKIHFDIVYSDVMVNPENGQLIKGNSARDSFLSIQQREIERLRNELQSTVPTVLGPRRATRKTRITKTPARTATSRHVTEVPPDPFTTPVTSRH